MFHYSRRNNQHWNARLGGKSNPINGSFLRKKVSWIILISLLSCTAQQLRNKNVAEEDDFNSLIQENSYFLWQYAQNPVKWNPWTDEILEDARASDRLIFLSIGYFGSQHAHNMEKETFRDSVLVEILNENMVPILVDRDERPDIAVYFSRFCEFFNEQSCSFPLNIILLPDRKPLFAASSLRPEIWADIVSRYSRLYELEREEALDLGRTLDNKMFDFYHPENYRADTRIPRISLYEIFQSLRNEIYQQRFLKDAKAVNVNPDLLNFLATYTTMDTRLEPARLLEEQLDKWAMGGTYDHLGGGFFLQSKDPNSYFPDFEKLLIDNARKLDLYANAFHLTRKQHYEQVMYESIESLERDFKMDNGSYLSSWDSYSEGEEGRYYLWSHIEIDAELGVETELFKRTYNVSRQGNWKARENVLYRKLKDAQLAYGYRIRTLEFQSELETMREKMLVSRQKRVKPDRDPKQICSWNARLIQAYVQAYRSTGDEKILSYAKRMIGALEEQNYAEFPRLNHINHQDQKEEFLEDYAQMILAYIELHQVSFDERYLQKAVELSTHTLSRFYSSTRQLFYYAYGGEDLHRVPFVEMEDGIMRNGNALMCEALFKLGLIMDKSVYSRTAEDMMMHAAPLLLEDPLRHQSWLNPYILMEESNHLIILRSEDNQQLRKDLEQEYVPNLLFRENFPDGYRYERNSDQPGYYICKGRNCTGPFEDPADLLDNL
ncbi:MAG: DUF255 domain-containing protein [Bacteroidota bacterium]